MATILCVSEQANEVDAVRPTLSAEGYDVFFAADGMRAMQFILSGNPDAAILFLTGVTREVWDLIPLVRRLDRKLPILTVATEDTVETQREIRTSRVFYHLIQPIDAAELTQALREALTRREERA